MKQLLCIGILLFALVGCAAVQQAKEDYQVGVSAPVAEGEKTPEQAANELVAVIEQVPYAGVAAPFLYPVLVGFARYQRGRRIRLQQPASVNPIWGNWGQKVGLEGITQLFANVSTAALEVGPDGSGFKRGWKMAAIVSLTLGAGVLAIPAVKEFVIANPQIAAGFTLITGVLAGLEKELSKVLPVRNVNGSDVEVIG